MSEKSDVQEPLLKYSQEIGWDCVKSADALKLRGGDRGLYFTEVLKKQLPNLGLNLQFSPEITAKGFTIPCLAFTWQPTHTSYLDFPFIPHSELRI